MSNIRLRSWLIIGLIFLVGAVTGAALTYGLRTAWMRPPGAKQMERHWMEYLSQRLDLTSDQQTKIEAILKSTSEKMKSVHDDEVSRISTLFKDADEQIKPLLTADQQTKFAQLQAERQHDFSRHMHHGWQEGGPPGGPHGGGPPPGQPPPGGPRPGDAPPDGGNGGT